MDIRGGEDEWERMTMVLHSGRCKDEQVKLAFKAVLFDAILGVEVVYSIEIGDDR